VISFSVFVIRSEAEGGTNCANAVNNRSRIWLPRLANIPSSDTRKSSSGKLASRKL
jgi:hypothetical protein